MKCTWDERKARRNERLHGVSFPLAEHALKSGLGIHAADQFVEDEWRLVILAPAKGIVLLHIVITLRNPEEYVNDTGTDQEDDEAEWFGENSIVRIITARLATTKEEALYFQDRLPSGL